MKNGPVVIKLEEQNRNFAYNKRQQISGAMQIKCESDQAQIQLRVDNLRPNNPKNYTYKVFFLGNKDGNSVYKVMGSIKVGRTGRGEMAFSVDPQNVDNKGTGLDAFFVFMVAAVPHGNGREPIQPVLKGDFQLPAEIPELASKVLETQEMPSSEPQAQQAGTRKEQKEYTSYYKIYVREKTAQLIDQVDMYMKLRPFENHWMTEEWRHVTEMQKLPVASLGAEKQISKYGHFIFAYNDELLVLAVPGRHTDEEWPDRGVSGFNLWQPIKDSKEYGYWSMVIERKTGIITEIS